MSGMENGHLRAVADSEDELGQDRAASDVAAPERSPRPRVGGLTGYVSATCRIGGHRLCQERRLIQCACQCHGEVVSVLWRQDNFITVTHDGGEVEVRRGSRMAARSLSEQNGLTPMPGAAVPEQGWVRPRPTA